MDRWNWCKYSIHSWNSQITFFQHHFIILKFHIFHLNHTHFPVFPCQPLTLMTSSLEKKRGKKKEKRKRIPSPFCVVHILAGAWSDPQWPAPWKLSPSFIPARSNQLWSATLQHPYHNFKECSSMASCLDYFSQITS